MDFKDLQKVFGNDIFKVNRSLYYEMRQYIVAKEHFSTQEILTFFSQKYNLEEIKKCLYLFYVAQGKIIATVDNNFNYDFEYVKERDLQKSNFTRHYFNNPLGNIDKFIVIADTHIGSEIASFDMINRVYDYASKNNIGYVIHLGDLFQKTKDESEYVTRIMDFLKYYPDDKSIKTLSILGNHDTILHERYWNNLNEFDLRYLTMKRPNFICYPKMETAWQNGDMSIHLAHHLYLNGLLRDVFLRKEEDLVNDEAFKIINFSDYDLLISGHLHKQMISYVNNGDSLLISVPSTSKLNDNDVIAFEIRMLDNKVIGITPLSYFDKNLAAESILTRKLK